MNSKFKMLKITPTDTLFFGEGKSFYKGESSWHQSRLFPYPSVFYGAICSAMLEKNSDRKLAYIKNRDKGSDPRKFLKLGGIYLYEKKNDFDENIYIPAPKDLFVNYKGIEYGCYIKSNEQLDCSLKSLQYFMQNPEIENTDRADDMFIDWNSFINAYFHMDEGIKLIEFNDVATYNYKVGIARDENFNTKDEHLYRLDLMDFKKGRWSYLVEYKIDESWWNGKNTGLDQGFLKLGGENKSCRYENFDIKNRLEYYNEQMSIENDWEYVKLLIKTPAIFKSNNWKPEFISNGIEVAAAVTAKPYSIGGFDMILKKPKPMIKAIPEGSVYILKSKRFKDKSFKEIKDIICESKIFLNYNKGFGQFEVLPLYEEQMGGIEIG